MNTTKANRALRKLAKEKGISVEEVRREIMIALEEGRKNPDPAIQENCKAIPCKGEYPTPEEVITYLAKKAKRKSL